MPYPLVSLIVLNWNGKALLEECLKSLLKTNYDNLETIVVDNGSTDGSVEMVGNFPNVRLIANKTNLGYAGGNNAGFKAANGKYVITVNNDIIVDPAWLVDPIRFLENDETIGVISCRQMNYFNKNTIDHLYSCPTSYLLPERMGHGKQYQELPQFSSAGFVLGASGASAMYRKKMLDEIGVLEESFFIYQEEIDLQMRAFLNGWKCLYVPSSVVYHKESVTMNKHKSMFYYLHERNRVWYIYRNYPLSIILQNLPVLLFRELRTMVNIIILRRMPFIYLKARFHGFSGMFKFSQLRQKNTALFKSRMQNYKQLFRDKIDFAKHLD
jgi:GT2 family glycosyltransferase